MAPDARTVAIADPGPRGASPRWPYWGVRFGTLLWAAGWTGFATLEGATREIIAVPYTAGFIAALAAPTIVAWRFPRAGGALLMLVGAAASGLLDHPLVQLFLVTPALGLGLCSLLLPQPPARTAARCRRGRTGNESTFIDAPHTWSIS